MLNPDLATWIRVLLVGCCTSACGGSSTGSTADSHSGGVSSTAGGSSSGGTSGGSDGGSSVGGTASSSTGGESTGSGGVAGTALLGEPCHAPGELACAGTFQKLGLVCGASAVWESNTTCAGDQFCDTRAGVARGTCQDQAADCVGQQPGYRFCEGSSVVECGVDTIETSIAEECSTGCSEGACASDECPSGNHVHDCAGDCGGDPAGATGPCGSYFAGCPGARLDGFDDYLERTVRTPPASALTCTNACAARAFVVKVPELSEMKVTAPAGWSIYSIEADPGAPWPSTCEGVPECLVAPPAFSEARYVALIPDSEAAPSANVVFRRSSELSCP